MRERAAVYRFVPTRKRHSGSVCEPGHCGSSSRPQMLLVAGVQSRETTEETDQRQQRGFVDRVSVFG